MKNKDTKISFSNEELSAIQNERFFILKNKITQKIYKQFAELIEEIKKSSIHQSFQFPPEVNISNGKISKGENYLLLPYIMLDFPKYFGNDGVFAFRTMFWWGKFFSFTFHLSGEYFENYRKNILSNFHLLSNQQVYFCIHSEEWKHDFEKENYFLIAEKNETQVKKILEKKSFIKLSRKIDLDKWNELNSVGVKSYELFLNVLK